MNLSRRTITLLGLFLCVATVLVGRQIGRRMQDKLDVLDSEISACRNDMDQANQEIQDKTHYVEKWGVIQKVLLQTVEEGQLEFDAYRIKLANDSGVVIREIAYSNLPMEGHSKFKILNCNLKLDCKIGELASFIALLDQEKDWLLHIESVNVKKAERSSFSATTFTSDLPSTKDIQADIVVSMPAAAAEKEGVKAKGISSSTLK
jgi:hypothetical protein